MQSMSSYTLSISRARVVLTGVFEVIVFLLAHNKNIIVVIRPVIRDDPRAETTTEIMKVTSSTSKPPSAPSVYRALINKSCLEQ